jgi:excisionase family DNA binding protein
LQLEKYYLVHGLVNSASVNSQHFSDWCADFPARKGQQRIGHNMSLSIVTVAEAAQRLGVHQETVRRWCRKTGFGIRFPGGRYKIPEAKIVQLEQDLAACVTQQGLPEAKRVQLELDLAARVAQQG